MHAPCLSEMFDSACRNKFRFLGEVSHRKGPSGLKTVSACKILKRPLPIFRRPRGNIDVDVLFSKGMRERTKHDPSIQ